MYIGQTISSLDIADDIYSRLMIVVVAQQPSLYSSHFYYTVLKANGCLTDPFRKNVFMI